LEQMYVMPKNFFQPVPVDRVLPDGDRIYDYVGHHAPGHCPGQICLQVHNVLLTADHILPRITPHQSPESITQSTGLDHYLEALDRFRNLNGDDLGLSAQKDSIEHQVEATAEHKR